MKALKKAQLSIFYALMMVPAFHFKAHKIFKILKKSSFGAHFIHISSNLSLLLFLFDGFLVGITLAETPCSHRLDKIE